MRHAPPKENPHGFHFLQRTCVPGYEDQNHLETESLDCVLQPQNNSSRN